MGVGGAGLAFGGVAGYLALNNRNSAQAACTSYPDHCSSDHSADSPNQAAQTWATMSTIGFIAGGVLAAAGVVVFVLPGGSKAQVAPSVGRGSSGLSVFGAF